MATVENEEVNVTLFNKKLSKILNKARIQDGTSSLRYSTADIEHWSHSRFSPPHPAARR